jgi:hypothetical protein
MTGNDPLHCTLCNNVLSTQRPPLYLLFQNAIEDSNMFTTTCKFNPLLPIFSPFLLKLWYHIFVFCFHDFYTGYIRRNLPHFRRRFLSLNYITITKNTYIHSSMFMQIMGVSRIQNCYTYTDYHTHFKTRRNL